MHSETPHILFHMAALSYLVGCGIEPGMVDEGAQLLIPGDLDVHWDVSLNDLDDGLGALVPIDVMTYDGATGEPLVGVALEIRGTSSGSSVWLPEEIELLGAEAMGPFSDDEGMVWWDAWRDRYFTWVGDEDLEEAFGVFEADDDAGDSRVGRLVDTVTDQTGLARVYLFVDRFPWMDDASDTVERFAPVAMTVTMSEADGVRFREDTFLLVPR